MSLRPAHFSLQHLRQLLVGMIAAILLAFLLWVFREELKALALQTAGRIKEAGPAAYFGTMALVPLPLAWFTVPAGELFGAQITLTGVIMAAMGAVVVQLSLSYAVARYVMRPVVSRLLRRRGYEVPRVTRENASSVVLLVRLLPGPPMILGSCLLALAETPFGVYLVLSSLVALPWVCAGVILGHGILGGHFMQAATGVMLVAALAIVVQLIKRRFRKPCVKSADQA
jgi:uncharacterized membrane protein YdjX (TVP38/TMEM64 family)